MCKCLEILICAFAICFTIYTNVDNHIQTNEKYRRAMSHKTRKSHFLARRSYYETRVCPKRLPKCMLSNPGPRANAPMSDGATYDTLII